jgi:hypothetical protein
VRERPEDHRERREEEVEVWVLRRGDVRVRGGRSEGGTPVLGGDRLTTSRRDFRAEWVVGIGKWVKCESGKMNPHLVDSGPTGRYDHCSRAYIEGIVAVSTGSNNIDYSS